MPPTIQEVSPLSTDVLNDIARNVEVQYENGQRMIIKKWVRLTKGETEIYIGDRQLVISFIHTHPENQDELERFAADTQKSVIKYLKSEGFILPNWIYVGLQNAEAMFESTFE